MMASFSIARISFLYVVPALAIMIPGSAAAQSIIQSSGPGQLVRIFNEDSAVLEAQEPRKDLPCGVNPLKPQLGFDMKFHAGYEVSIPLRELSGAEDLLTTIFRVTPENKKDDPLYFSQRTNVPAIEPDAHGNAYLQGYFDVGEGKYHVDFLIRDRSERVCSSYWDTEASLPGKEKQLSLVIPAGTIAAADLEPFKEEPPVDRAVVDTEHGDGPLNVKVLVNFAPQNSRSATLQPLDMNALVAILRSIAREPRIGRFSIVAFNMQEQRVLYRQEASEQIDFPALGEALNSLKLGTVDLKRLSQKHGDTEFLTGLISQEMSAKDRPDALIFAGPKVMLDQSVPQDTLREIGQVEYPIFYMNYNFNPQSNPWRDAIGNTVKFFRGFEYTISRPPDLWHAWTEIMSRIVKFRIGRRESGSSSQ
jgi:hypothetical protein